MCNPGKSQFVSPSTRTVALGLAPSCKFLSRGWQTDRCPHTHLIAIYYDMPCICKNWCELFTCKEMIDLIWYGEFWVCEFHFLLYFWVVQNTAKLEWQKAPENVHYCRSPRCHRMLLWNEPIYFIQIRFCKEKTW